MQLSKKQRIKDMLFTVTNINDYINKAESDFNYLWEKQDYGPRTTGQNYLLIKEYWREQGVRFIKQNADQEYLRLKPEALALKALDWATKEAMREWDRIG